MDFPDRCVSAPKSRWHSNPKIASLTQHRDGGRARFLEPSRFAPPPTVLAEIACTAALLGLVLLFYRWLQRDMQYTRQQMERDDHHQTEIPASKQSRSSSIASQATTRSVSSTGNRSRASSISSARGEIAHETAQQPPQVSSQLRYIEPWIAPTQKQRTPEERRARKEHLRAKVDHLLSLVGDHDVADDDALMADRASSPFCSMPALLDDAEKSVRRYAPGCESDSCLQDDGHGGRFMGGDLFLEGQCPQPRKIGRSRSFGRTYLPPSTPVSGASRYAAQQLLKRRTSNDPVSPVGTNLLGVAAQHPTAIFSRASSSALITSAHRPLTTVAPADFMRAASSVRSCLKGGGEG